MKYYEKIINYEISSWIPWFFLQSRCWYFLRKMEQKTESNAHFTSGLKNHDRQIFSSFLRIQKYFDHAFCIEKTDDHLLYRGFGRSNLRQTNENYRQTFYAFWTDESFASQREKTLSKNFPRAQKWFSSLRDVFSLHDTVYSQHSVT